MRAERDCRGEPEADTEESESLLFCFQRGGKAELELFAFLSVPGSRVSGSGAGGGGGRSCLGLDLALWTLAVPGGSAGALHTPVRAPAGDAHSKKLLRLQQESSEGARQLNHPNEPLWEKSSGGQILAQILRGCLRQAGCGQESRGRHLNSCRAAAPLSTSDISKEQWEQEEQSLSGQGELCQC